MSHSFDVVAESSFDSVVPCRTKLACTKICKENNIALGQLIPNRNTRVRHSLFLMIVLLTRLYGGFVGLV